MASATPRAPSMSTSSAVTVRPLESSDLDRVLAINNAHCPAVGELTAASLAFLLEHSLYAYGIDIDGLCAYIIALGPGTPYQSPNYRWFGDRHDSFVYVDRIAVDGAHKNRGFGVLLYEAIETRLQAGTILCCEVNLEPPNPGSLRFHHRLGFTEVGQLTPKTGYRVSLLEKRS